MANPDQPPNGDIEHGNFEKELERGRADLALANDEDQGEYGNLVRYISNYKDGRRASTIGGDDDLPPKPWWKFWAKSHSEGGLEGFETPDDWLETDMKRGLTTQIVESRRKK